MAIDWEELAKFENFSSKIEMLNYYYNKWGSAEKVGKHLGVTGKTVLNHLHKENIPVRPQGGANNVGPAKESLLVTADKERKTLETLTLEGVASYLRCSYAHACKVCRVKGVNYLGKRKQYTPRKSRKDSQGRYTKP